MKTEETNPITTELAKNNVTEAVIANLKKMYLPLKINGIEDKEGYKRVHDARIVCRDTRVLAEKICKKGREDAIKEQKMWISKEKEVVAEVSEVEQYLKKQEDVIDQIVETQKIRAERLLKLPGRKEESTGMQNYFTMNLTDENIMSFNDAEWKELLLIAKSRKLDEQQKIIDDKNAKELLERTIKRENKLIATGATLYSDGLGKVYRKGKTSVSEQMIKDCIDEGWPKIVEVFQNAIIPPISSGAFLVTERIAKAGAELAGQTDEEKLFYFAGNIENLSRPVMKTKEGKDTLALAEGLLTQAIELLRQ